MAQTTAVEFGRKFGEFEHKADEVIPTIAEVDGTRIMVFPFDHDPPHVHAFGADFRVKLAISDARVLETSGTIGPAVMRRLRQWVLRHRGRLSQLWSDARRGNPISRIEE